MYSAHILICIAQLTTQFPRVNAGVENKHIIRIHIAAVVLVAAAPIVAAAAAIVVVAVVVSRTSVWAFMERIA